MRASRTTVAERDDSDDALIGRAQSGDPGAFGELVRRHDDKMRGLAFRLVGNRGDMDDVLQDAYIKAYRSIGQFDVGSGGASFSSWLYRVVHSCCIDHYRWRARRPQVPLGLIAEPVTKGDPAVSAVTRSAVREALASVSPDHAAVIALIEGDGYSYEETAELLGISAGTVASRLSRARVALRVHFEHGDHRVERDEVDL